MDDKKGAWNQNQLFSSDKHDWATPWALFNEVDKEFGFTLDAAASAHNAKCKLYLTREDDALTKSWSDLAEDGSVWLNPPYGREIGLWIEKAYRESLNGSPVVCLTFCRTDTKWWHRWAMRAAEVRIIPGRITFGGATAGAPAPSCLIVFDEGRRMPRFVTQELPRK
jgi:phage N-6-adenine-methyltransferase